jgi:hypothetical protein
VTELPDTHRLVELADAFEKLRGPRPDPQEADHRQQGLQALGGIAAALVGAVAGYSARRP